jgi:hypothetical protein
MLMMMDAFQPEGYSILAVDSIFMMPHLGVLSKVNETAATQVFDRDCMIYLGTHICPVGHAKFGDRCMSYKITFPDGHVEEGDVPFGEIRLFPLAVGEKAAGTFTPARGFDLGEGRGRTISRELHGGVVGIVLDTRGRPLVLPSSKSDRVEALVKWADAMKAYPNWKK